MLFAAERRIGLDAGQDQATQRSSQAEKDSVAARFGVQMRDDVHGLDVYAEQPPMFHGAQLQLTGTSLYVIRDYEEPLRAFYRAQVILTAKQQLALDLYNASHFDGTSKTRFLALVTVVEVLAVRAERSLAVRALLTELLAVVRSSALIAEEKQRLCNGISDLKRDSIAGACRDVIARYAHAEDVAFFMNCYKARSELLHDGQTARREANDLTKLDVLVSHVLVSSLTKVV